MKSNYKKNLTLSVLIGFLLSSFFSERMEAKIELIDRVIAVVDSGVIMESELNLRVQDIIGRPVSYTHLTLPTSDLV